MNNFSLLTLPIVFFLCSLPVFSHASKTNEIEAILLEIQFGEKKSLFLIEKKSTGGEVSFSNSGAVSRPAQLSQKNWDFIVSQAEEIQRFKSEGFQCPRSSIELKIKGKSGHESRSSCVESKSILGQKLNQLSELLLVLF